MFSNSTCDVLGNISTNDICRNVNNNGKGESYGGELSATYDFNSKTRMSLAYSFAKIFIESGGDESRENTVPQNQFSARSYYDITPKLQWNNSVYFSEGVAGFQDSVGAYIKVDAKLNYALNDNLDMSLVGQNLTDHYHQEFERSMYSRTREIGRSIFIKISYDF